MKSWIREGAAAGLASARMTEEQQWTLLRRLEELHAASNPDEPLEADIVFHASIAARAGTIVLAVATKLETGGSFDHRAVHAEVLVAQHVQTIGPERGPKDDIR